MFGVTCGRSLKFSGNNIDVSDLMLRVLDEKRQENCDLMSNDVDISTNA